MSQFETKWDTLTLLAIIREVLLFADPEQPASVSQRSYNASRAPAGYSTTPRADHLAKRFGVSWPVLADRVATHADPQFALSMAAKSQVRPVLTKAEVITALKIVAARNGTDVMRVEDYERTRKAINQELKRRHRHGAHLTPLPSIHSLCQKMSFPEAVKAAGLRVPERTGQRLVPRIEVIRLFIEHCGFAPRVDDLRWFGNTHRIQMVGRFRSPKHSEQLAELREQFEAQGRWWPERKGDMPLPDHWQEQASVDSPALQAARDAYPARVRESYTLEDIVDGIRKVFDLLEPGEKATVLRYTAIAKEHGLPQQASVQRVAKAHGTSYLKLVQQVARERAEAAKTP